MNRQEFFEKVRDKAASEEIPRIAEAYWLAKVTHRNQKRDCGERYFEHCRRVACFLMDRGETSADEIMIALIHDCVEDGFIPDGVIRSLFGEEVANAVAILSKVAVESDESTGLIQKQRKSDEEYFGGIRNASTMIRRIKLADRLDNLRSMHASWTKERKQKYVIETEAYILPIAHMTDENFARELEEEIRHAFREPFEYAEMCVKCKKSVVLFRLWMNNNFFEFSNPEAKSHLSVSIEEVCDMRDALEVRDFGKVDEILRRYNKAGLPHKYFCAKGNHFYCKECNNVKVVSDGWSLDFYDRCPVDG